MAIAPYVQGRNIEDIGKLFKACRKESNTFAYCKKDPVKKTEYVLKGLQDIEVDPGYLDVVYICSGLVSVCLLVSFLNLICMFVDFKNVGILGYIAIGSP